MKKLSQKNVIKAGKSFVGFEAGRRLSNGVANIIPGETLGPTAKQIGIAALSLIGAAIYSGPQSDLVVPALIGMAAEQGGHAIDQGLSKVVPATAPQFIKDVSGLNGSLGCACNGWPPQGYTALAAPSVAGIANMAFNPATNQYELEGA